MAFNATTKPTFGVPTTSVGGFGFGTTNPTVTSATGFGFGVTNPATTSSASLFLQQPKTSVAGIGTGFGFGATNPAVTTGTGFSFGVTNPATTSSGGLFLQQPKSTAAGIGAGFFGGNTGFGTGGFGTATSGFGTSLGMSTGLGTGTGTGLGNVLGTGSTFGTTLGGGLGVGFGAGTGLAQANPQHDAATNLANMARAVSVPLVFGDERDAVLAKWNQLQAFWGTGKGYYTQQGNSVDFTPENLFCRFKAVGYSCLPKKKNEDGLVVVVFAKKMADVTSNQQAVVDTFQKLLGNKPNLTVCVDSVRELPSDKTEMVIYVQERSPAGIMSRVAATTLFTYLQSQSTAIKSTFGTVLPVDNIFPKTGLNPEQLKHYLDNPPSGIDPLIWEQAKLDNPNPEVLIPVPMIGFTELHNRLKHQEQQTKLHQSRLNIITEDIGALQKNQTSMVSKIEEYKRRHLELGHRVLQVMVKQEIYRKLGYAIQADEEQLRVQLEAIQAELNAPTQFKGRLNELMSQMRMQHQIGAARQESCYQIDGSVQAEIKQHLKQQQEGLQHLISIIKDDVDDLLLIEHGLTEKKTHPR